MFTFANPWLLWLFPALALPWIFRRRQEERIRHINFPLLQFLRESEEKELVNPQLQELLLLILRTLLLALLILSLAGPKWSAQSSTRSGFLSFLPFGRSLQTHVVAMDSSYSMGYGQGDQSIWREAEKAWEAVERDLRGFSTRMIQWDRSTIRPNQKNRLIALSALERESLFASTPKEPGASVLELIESMDDSFENAGSLILITDGQRFPWSDLLQENLDRRSIPKILVATVGGGPVANAWAEIDSLSSPPWGIAGWEAVAGRVKALYPETPPAGTISILQTGGNETLYSRPASFPDSPNQTVVIPFEFTPQFSDLRAVRQLSDAGGELHLTLRVEPLDLLPLDNEIELNIPVISSFSVGVACQGGEESPILSVLLSAVNPLRGAPESPPVLIERISPPEMTFGENLDFALLAGDLISSWLSAEEIQAPLDYVKNGGSILLFTGPKESSDNPWSQLLQNLGWQWFNTENEAEQPDSLSIGGTGLFGKALSAWDESMWAHWIPAHHGRVQDDSAIPLAAYRIGDQTAYLVTQLSLGKGRVWIVNTSLSPDEDPLLSPLLPALIWETGKEVARQTLRVNPSIPAERFESDLTRLSVDEKALLTERYGIRFADINSLGNALDRVYGGVDLRLALLFLCVLLALGESWLSNRLASM
ncbi:MAG: BatA domain-containing protein [Candidatus Omnitrophica bacterium]|nr:BatA domain-containing protein [Candidatus Omnitrophota bacterium]